MAACTLVLTACAAGGGDDSTDDGEAATDAASPAGEWALVEGDGPAGPVDVPDETRVTLLVEDVSDGRATIGGLAACNSYGGEVELDGTAAGGGDWTGGPFAVTEMMCVDEAVMEAEVAFLTALEAVSSWERAGDELRLTGGTDTALVFATVPPAPVEELVGTTWRLDGLVTGTGDDAAIASPVASGEDATLVLADDGTVTASTGCRSFEGDWTAVGSEIRFVPNFGEAPDSPNVGADGTPTCDDDLLAQEGHVLSVLGDGFVPTVDGDRLTLTSGALGLVYVAVSSG